MADPVAEEPISNISESSFVILGQGSLPPGTNGSDFNSIKTERNLLSMEENSEESHSNYSEASSFFEGNPHERLKKLLQENYQLRETLNQNNLAIKSQLDTFVMWQQEVLKTHETHKTKFLETKDLILKLRAENARLKKLLEDRDVEIGASGDGDLVSQINLLKAEIEVMKSKIKHSEEFCKEITDKNEILNMRNCSLKKLLEKTDMKCLELRKDVDGVLRENKSLIERIDSYSNSMSDDFSYVTRPNLEVKTQLLCLCKKLEEKRTEVNKLKEEIETYKAFNATDTKETFNQELCRHIDKLNNVSSMFVHQNQNSNECGGTVTVVEDNALKNDNTSKAIEDCTTFEIEDLLSNVHQEENSFKEKQDGLLKLYEDYQQILLSFKEVKQKLSLTDSNNLNFEKLKNEVADLTAQLEFRDKELIAKQEECDRLKEDLKKLTLESEELATLRVVVDLYQSEYNDEQAAKRQIQNEKDEIENQLLLLQNRN